MVHRIRRIDLFCDLSAFCGAGGEFISKVRTGVLTDHGNMNARHADKIALWKWVDVIVLCVGSTVEGSMNVMDVAVLNIRELMELSGQAAMKKVVCTSSDLSILSSWVERTLPVGSLMPCFRSWR